MPVQKAKIQCFNCDVVSDALSPFGLCAICQKMANIIDARDRYKEELGILKAHNARMIDALDWIALSMSYLITHNVQTPGTVQELHPKGIPQIKRATIDELTHIIQDTHRRAIEAQEPTTPAAE